MMIYTIQQHQPSGECHILTYDADNRITAASDAIDHTAVEALATTPRMLRYCQVNTEDAAWASEQQWGAPLAEWEEA